MRMGREEENKDICTRGEAHALDICGDLYVVWGNKLLKECIYVGILCSMKKKKKLPVLSFYLGGYSILYIPEHVNIVVLSLHHLFSLAANEFHMLFDMLFFVWVHAHELKCYHRT